MLERLAVPVLAPLGTIGIMLIVAVFILMQMEDLRDRLIRLFGSGDLHRTTAAMDEAAVRLSRYFLTQLAMNTGFGVVVGAGLFVIGVPSPALFGIIAALFRFIPYVGAIGAALLPTVLAAAVDPGWTMAVETAAMFVSSRPSPARWSSPWPMATAPAFLRFPSSSPPSSGDGSGVPWA